jgi:hypothetical protein
MTPDRAYEICYKENKRIRELEDIIASSSYYSYKYSFNIIKGRFEEGEKIISTADNWSYGYAKHVIKGPFYLGHPIIFNSECKHAYIDFLKSINYDLNEISEWLI